MWNYRVVRKKHSRIELRDGQECTEYTYAIHEERVEKEGNHRENFIGTKGLKKLMDKIYSDYREKNIMDRKKCL